MHFVFTRGADYDVRVGNVMLRCRFGDNVTEYGILARGAHRQKLTQIISELRPGSVFLDIGANCGVFTSIAADAVGPSGRVIAVEPIPAMIDRLQFNLAANGFRNVSLFKVAISDAPGTAVLNISDGNYGSSSLVQVVCSGRRPLEVDVMTLEQVVVASGVNRVDLLKIDVEGFEDKALLPYIANMPPSMWPSRIFIEMKHAQRWRTDCRKALVAAGYVQVWGDGKDALLSQT